MRGVLSGSHLDGETGCCFLKWLCWHEVSCIVAYIRLAAALLPLILARPVVLQGNLKWPLGYRELRVMSLKWMEDTEMFLTKVNGCVIMDCW
ncbi:hypothetical protein PO909_024348 [Leuciscus waleckii]